MSEEPYFAISEMPPLPKPNTNSKRAKSHNKKSGKRLKGRKILAPESPGDKFTIEEIYWFKPSKALKSNAANPFL